MSSPVVLYTLDDASRQRALDPSRSFTVRAPAGSGKTELLIQRFLQLLAIVQKPESIVAITFTRKAAGEMLERIAGALRDARAGTPVEQPHLAITRKLALGALARGRELGWDLLEHPGRLRVQTIDYLCMWITGEMPWLARLGGMPGIEEDARSLYEQAAHLTLLDESPDYQDALTTLLRHLDNKAAHAQDLIATMLARRDQWLRLVHLDDVSERAELEDALARTVAQGLAKTNRLIPVHMRADWISLARFRASNLQTACADLANWPAAMPEAAAVWMGLAETVLTKDTWRKRGGLTVRSGFPPGSDSQKDRCTRLIEALQQRDGLLVALQSI